MKMVFFTTIILLSMIISNCSPSQKSTVIGNNANDNKLVEILHRYPEFFDSILNKKDQLNLQIIYSEINRKKNNEVSFTDFYFNVDKSNYFYPASTVKFPVAVLALQKLNELNIAGLDKNTTMLTRSADVKQTEVLNDSTSADHRPTIAHYIKKILLVSDNDAFNRLYEFLGQEYINTSLQKMGYTDVQIIHRLSISLNEDENRHTNPVSFYDADGHVIYEKPAEKSKFVYANRDTKLGKGYMSGDSLVNEPFDFSKKNRMNLADLHDMIRSVIFPESVPSIKRFGISADDYDFLRKHMSMFPGESKHPFYAPSEYYDTYVKHFMHGNDKINWPPDIRVFNKTGTAYGFLIDVSYIADFKNNIEFMVTAVISCNSDGIYNDDQYEYDSIGYPFFKHLGQVIYDHEIKRVRKNKPDLSLFKFDYNF